MFLITIQYLLFRWSSYITFQRLKGLKVYRKVRFLFSWERSDSFSHLICLLCQVCGGQERQSNCGFQHGVQGWWWCHHWQSLYAGLWGKHNGAYFLLLFALLWVSFKVESKSVMVQGKTWTLTSTEATAPISPIQFTLHVLICNDPVSIIPFVHGNHTTESAVCL